MGYIQSSPTAFKPMPDALTTVDAGATPTRRTRDAVPSPDGRSALGRAGRHASRSRATRQRRCLPKATAFPPVARSVALERMRHTHSRHRRAVGRRRPSVRPAPSPLPACPAGAPRGPAAHTPTQALRPRGFRLRGEQKAGRRHSVRQEGTDRSPRRVSERNAPPRAARSAAPASAAGARACLRASR